jgi:hypothetical protein
MNHSTADALVRRMVATTTLAATPASHLGWWLDWQTRARLSQGCRTLDDASS